MITFDTTKLLHTPARIIAEDDDHIVFALRIEKKLVHSNIALLQAVMEAALDTSHRVTPRQRALHSGTWSALLTSPAGIAANWTVTILLGLLT